jgi:hypothetical protein
MDGNQDKISRQTRKEIDMKITLDRRNCNCWQPACESHFGWHFLREEVTPIDCTVEIIDDGTSVRTFIIKDRDGINKQLLVDDHNWAEAYDSWQLAWEAQQSVTGE